jgi:hypothetical protein
MAQPAANPEIRRPHTRQRADEGASPRGSVSDEGSATINVRFVSPHAAPHVAAFSAHEATATLEVRDTLASGAGRLDTSERESRVRIVPVALEEIVQRFRSPLISFLSLDG